MTKRKVDGDELTCDRIAAALVDRLISLEARVKAQDRELQRQFELLAEIQAKRNPDGTLTLRAITGPVGVPEEYDVVVQAVSEKLVP